MIDRDRIGELQQEIGATDLGLVIDVFIGEAEETLAQIKPGLGRAEQARAAHFLRSGALDIGFTAIAGLADRLERGEAPDTARAVAELRAALVLSRGQADFYLA